MDNQDPEKLGRVKLRYPWALDRGNTQTESGWARMSHFMAGNQRGAWFIPEIGDEVLVAFVGGDPNIPVVLGAMWNGEDTPPPDISANDNSIRQIRTRSGLTLTFDDEKNGEAVSIETPNGSIVSVGQSDGIKIAASSGSVVIDEKGRITVQTKKNTVIRSSTITLEAASITLNSAMVTCDGLLKCETLTATSVIAENYSPGEGNLL